MSTSSSPSHTVPSQMTSIPVGSVKFSNSPKHSITVFICDDGSRTISDICAIYALNGLDSQSGRNIKQFLLDTVGIGAEEVEDPDARVRGGYYTTELKSSVDIPDNRTVIVVADRPYSEHLLARRSWLEHLGLPKSDIETDLSASAGDSSCQMM